MTQPRPDDDSVLVLRLMIASDGSVRIRVIAISSTTDERVVGNVTSSSAAAELVSGWIDAATERVSPREPPRGQ